MRKYVTRVELYFNQEDILNCNDKTLKNYKARLGGIKCSLHLPNFPKDQKKIDLLVGSIDTIVSELSIEYCVLHADEYVKLKLNLPNIQLGVKFGLENSDLRKFGFQHLKELQIFDLPAIIDINHIEENKRGSLDREIKDLQNPILGIHFSSPQSGYFDSFPEIKTTHFPFTRSGYPLPKQLPKNIPIIIEGAFPPNDEVLIEEEVLIIEDNYFCLL